MEPKNFSVAIIGCGNRGCENYYPIMQKLGTFSLSAICDPDPVKLKKYGERFGVPEDARFSGEEAFFAARRADVLIVSSPDRCHVRQAIAGMKLGYDLLLEKPLTDDAEECRELLRVQSETGAKVMVCHVLRYAPAFVRLAELLREGVIGDLVSIETTEQVGYFHYAHSYVRGNWRSREETTPMILAKCCHDLDLLQFYAGARCERVSSVGSLRFFTAENAPADAADRCLDCPRADTCPYSAKEIYLRRWEKAGSPAFAWPVGVITPAYPLTEEAITKAMREGPYGRCVFHSDNDVVDHQQTLMTFENGITATLTMTGFTAGMGRLTHFFGTLGQLTLDEERNRLLVRPFGAEETVIDTTTLGIAQSSHGGGDRKLIEDFYRVLSGGGTYATSLAASVESHLMGIAAENSRLQGGKAVEVH